MNDKSCPLVNYESEDDSIVENNGPETTFDNAKIEVDEYGKVRNVPHTPGLWATHVSLTIESRGLSKAFQNSLSSINSLLENQGKPPAYLLSNLHISLSPTVFLRQVQIDPFINKLQESLYKSARVPFKVRFDRIDAFINDEGTRSFLALGVCHEDVASLNECLNVVVSPVLQHFKLPILHYDPPVFHSSFAWAINDTLCMKPITFLPTLTTGSFVDKVSTIVLPKVVESEVCFSYITVRTGNLVHQLAFPQNSLLLKQ